MYKVVLIFSFIITSFNSFALDRYTVTDLVKRLRPAVVTIYQKNGLNQQVSSGVIVSSGGFIITNQHAIDGSKVAEVKVSDSKTYIADVKSFDKKTDIAILKIRSQEYFPYVVFADSDEVQVGELVFAIGSPYGLEHSVSMGIISGKNRVVGGLGYEDFLQTDASINPGNSGGPLFNLDGNLIGINTAALMPNGSTNGIGFAIPSNLVKRIVNDLKDNGVVNRPTLGIEVTDVTSVLKNQLNLKDYSGAIIYKMDRSSPLLLKGVRVGDVIVRFNEKQIDSANDLTQLVEYTQVGSLVRLTILRDGRMSNITVRMKKNNTN